jgi:hypothetical protein
MYIMCVVLFFSLFYEGVRDLFGTRYRRRQVPVFVDLDQGL